MGRSLSIFALLADQAETGDPEAQLELRLKLEPELMHIVRRVVCEGAGRSSIDRRIFAEARRIGLDADCAASAEGHLLIRQVARTVSRLLIEGIRANARKPLHLQETICA
jgi:hypothetical protein